MIAAPPALYVPAPRGPALESALVLASAMARRAADPASALSAPGAVEDKLAAIDALQAGLPHQKRARQRVMLSALLAAARGGGQPAEVRAKALTHLGYCAPVVEDDELHARAIKTLLAALEEPAFRVAALRGLSSAVHNLPSPQEEELQTGLLDFLDGPARGDERVLALVALQAFVLSRDELARRKPALAADLDRRLLEPLEKDPARFARDPRGTAGSRELVASIVWFSARRRQESGDEAPAARARAALERLEAAERSAEVKAWISNFLSADPPRDARRAPRAGTIPGHGGGRPALPRPSAG